MLRRLLLVLSTISVILSVQSRPTPTAPEDSHHLHVRSKSGEPFSPVIVPVSDPASLLRRTPVEFEPGLLLGRHYQVVKRDPSPIMFMSPALESSLSEAKGEKPYSPPMSMSPSKRAPMPMYIAQRDRYEANYLSNVRPGPVYPQYLPYDPPKPDATSLLSSPTPTQTSEVKSHPEEDKKSVHSSEKDKESKQTKVTKGKEPKKHKSG